MVHKEITPPPEAVADASSSPLTPNPKRARMTSPEKTVETPQKTETTDEAARQPPESTEATPVLDAEAALVDDEEVEAVCVNAYLSH